MTILFRGVQVNAGICPNQSGVLFGPDIHNEFFLHVFFVQFKLKCVLTFSTMHYKANLAQTLLGKPYTEKI